MQQVYMEHEPWGGSFTRHPPPPPPSPPPLRSSGRGDRVGTKVEQRGVGGVEGGGERVKFALGYSDRKVGFTASLMDCYPTGPCLAQSRCSVNVRRMDGCHWTSEDPVRYLPIQTGPGRQEAWRTAPRTSKRGADTSPRSGAAAATPSRHHVDLKPTLPPGSCPSSVIGRSRPHLCPIK